MNEPLAVTGIGVVSPAGWGLPAFREALARGEPIPAEPAGHPGQGKPLPIRRVPAAAGASVLPAHPRLRRASPIARFAVAAALEALGAAGAWGAAGAPGGIPEAGDAGLAVIFCSMTGPVIYSRRFYEEVLTQPATASPMLFPETVYNAPTSHLAAVLGLNGRTHTEIGDGACFLKAFDTARLWLETGAAERCLLLAAEEADWLAAGGLELFNRAGVSAEGSGALLLEKAASARRPLAWLDRAVSSPLYAIGGGARAALAALRRGLASSATAGTLLVDGSSPSGRMNRLHAGTWRDWEGPRLSPKPIFGEAWAAGTAWQCVAAVDALARGAAPEALVSAAGEQERALGLRLRAP